MAASREAERLGIKDVDAHFEASEEELALEKERSIERSMELQSQRDRLLDALNGGMSRRELLKRGAMFGAALAGTGALMSGPFIRRARAAGPRVVIVGGGFAGMTAAYRISQAKGWIADVYEAQDHLGGRARTITGLSGSQHAEGGGEAIDSRHVAIQSLAQELGLWPLADTWIGYDGDDIFYFQGARVGASHLRHLAAKNNAVAWRAWTEIGRRIPTYKHSNAAAKRYDRMSVKEFIDDLCPYGTNTLAGRYLRAYLEADYAGNIEEMSALHYILDQAGIWSGGGWNERWSIPGGNTTLATTLAAQLPGGAIHYDRPLQALRRESDGTYTLTFGTGGTPVDVVADRVVLAIPPTALSDVDLSGAGFSPVKLRSIERERLGSNTKMNFQFSSRPWMKQGEGGALTDEPFGLAWQSSFQALSPAIMILYSNGDFGDHPAHGQASAAVRTQMLDSLEKLWPGMKAAFIGGQAWMDHWRMDPWAKGSYAFYRPGGFTAFGGIQSKRQGHVHFAGEHTVAYIERGYMNAAVMSGNRVANEVTSY